MHRSAFYPFHSPSLRIARRKKNLFPNAICDAVAITRIKRDCIEYTNAYSAYGEKMKKKHVRSKKMMEGKYTTGFEKKHTHTRNRIEKDIAYLW